MKLFVALLLLACSAFAAPVLIDATPANNSYTGKGSVTFYVNSTSPDVRLFVISEDAYINQESWDNYTMNCAADRCSRTVSFSIAGSDTFEYFYFEANDSGGTATYTSPASPLKFRIDRTFPQVIFTAPRNSSYISGTQTINVSVSDTVSGVNMSLLAYSIGSGWVPFAGAATFDTTLFSNGQPITVSVNATDNARNSGIVSIGVIADNAAPALSAAYPNATVVKGAVSFNITATDAVSGLNTSRVFVTINATNFYMTCSGICNATIDTKAYADGPLTAVFHAYDNASNSASASVNFSVLNTPPPLALTPKGYSNTYPLIIANLTNPDGIITDVAINVSKGNFTSASMSCNPEFTFCLYQLPSWGEGAYQIAAAAQNTIGHLINDTGTLTVDTTLPGLTVSIPDVIKAAYSITAQIDDANNNRNSVTLTILGNPQNFACVPQSTTLYCSIVYDFASISDGRYNATVHAADLAGNSASYTKEVLVDRNPPLLLDTIVEPLNPAVSNGVLITAVLTDIGSDVAYANAKVISVYGEQDFVLVRDGYNWSVSFFSSNAGAYNITINATDENGNSATFNNAGYFFMGILPSCGNSICSTEENYCICPQDCAAPQCSYGSVSCNSGVASCGTKSPPRCGDYVCSAGENCNTCSYDCGTCLGSAPKATRNNSTHQTPGNEVTQTAAGIYQFATSSTPVFSTILAVIILSTIIVVLWKKRRRSYY